MLIITHRGRGKEIEKFHVLYIKCNNKYKRNSRVNVTLCDFKAFKEMSYTHIH